MSYIEQATKIILDSGVAATALLSDDESLCVFSPIIAGIDTPLPEEFAGTKVRSVGVVGATGDHTAVAFNEPLDCDTVEAISTAFAAYVNTVNGMEIAELERLYTLPDLR